MLDLEKLTRILFEDEDEDDDDESAGGSAMMGMVDADRLGVEVEVGVTEL